MAANSNKIAKPSLIYPPFPKHSDKSEKKSEHRGVIYAKRRELVTAHYFNDENIPDTPDEQAALDFLSFDVSRCWELTKSIDESSLYGHDYNYIPQKGSVFRSNLKYNDSDRALAAFAKSLETYWNSRNFSVRPSVSYSPKQTECILKFLEEKINNSDKQIKSMARSCYNNLKSHLTYSDTRMFEFRAVLYPEYQRLIDLNFLIMRTIKDNALSDSGESCWIYRDLAPLINNDSRLQGHTLYHMGWKKKTSTTLSKIFERLGGINGVVHWLENYDRITENGYRHILIDLRNLLVAGIENSDQLFAERNFAPVYRTLLAEVNTRLEEMGVAPIEEPKVKESKMKAFVDSCSSFFGSSTSSGAGSSKPMAQQTSSMTYDQ